MVLCLHKSDYDCEILLIPVNSLRCHQCALARCGTSEELIECSERTVNYVYQHLEPMADLYAQATSIGKYQCFTVTLSDGNNTAMVKSCTYGESNICTGWKQGITVQECKTCETDYCNGFDSDETGSSGSGQSRWSRWYWLLVVVALFAIQIGSTNR